MSAPLLSSPFDTSFHPFIVQNGGLSKVIAEYLKSEMKRIDAKPKKTITPDKALEKNTNIISSKRTIWNVVNTEFNLHY